MESSLPLARELVKEHGHDILSHELGNEGSPTGNPGIKVCISHENGKTLEGYHNESSNTSLHVEEQSEGGAGRGRHYLSRKRRTVLHLVSYFVRALTYCL